MRVFLPVVGAAAAAAVADVGERLIVTGESAPAFGAAMHAVKGYERTGAAGTVNQQMRQVSVLGEVREPRRETIVVVELRQRVRPVFVYPQHL